MTLVRQHPNLESTASAAAAAGTTTTALLALWMMRVNARLILQCRFFPHFWGRLTVHFLQ